MSSQFKRSQKLNFSKESFSWFILMEIFLSILFITYLVILSSDLFFSIVGLILSLVVTVVMILIGMLLATITRVRWLYFLLHAVLVYPVVSAWFEMIKEDDWLQVLVDFLVLTPLMGGILISLPGFLLLKKRSRHHIETETIE